MTLLLDSHAFMWAAMNSKRLSVRVRHQIASGNAMLSVASIWEIAIKLRIGKLGLNLSMPDVAQAVKDLGVSVLNVNAEHAYRVGQLPDHHRDPFDRMIIAQAIEEDAWIATTDAMIQRYAVNVYW